VGLLFELPPGVLNRVEVGGVGRLISGCNSVFCKPILDLFGCVDRSIILHEDVAFVQLLVPIEDLIYKDLLNRSWPSTHALWIQSLSL
jgi:hypothetical protein